MKKFVLLIIVLFSLFIITGCRYYEVTDVTTGKIYYTRDVDYKKGGAIGFEDAQTDAEIVIQSSEVREINKDQFEAALCPGK